MSVLETGQCITRFDLNVGHFLKLGNASLDLGLSENRLPENAPKSHGFIGGFVLGVPWGSTG